MSFAYDNSHRSGRRLLLFLTPLALILVSNSATAQSDRLEEAEKLSQEGAQFQKQGDYSKATEALVHALAIKEKELGLDHLGVVPILYKLGFMYIQEGRYADAEPLYKRVLAIDERALSPDHPDVAAALYNLGSLYIQEGRYADAEPMLKRALAIKENALGPDHPDVGDLLNNLGSLHIQQGRYADAEPMLKRALAIKEKTLGPDHPGVAAVLNNLGYLYNELGRYADAEPFYKRSLAMKEKALGPDDTAIATSLNNLSVLYQYLGRYTEAELLQKRALAIREKTLGLNHPDVANALSNLAGVYRDQRRYAEAEPLYSRALAILEKTLGPDHLDVSDVLESLGSLYIQHGRYRDAEPVLKRALVIREKVLGPDHPGLAVSLGNLAVLYHDQGRYADAEPMLKRALAIQEKALGPDDAAVARSLNDLAVLYKDEGHPANAEPLERRALEIFEKALGPDNADVAISLNNLANIYQDQGLYTKAEPLHKRALAIQEKALGADDPAVADILNNLALGYVAQSRYPEAEPMMKRVLAIREKALGPDDPAVANALNNLTGVYERQRRHEEAEHLTKRALAILEKTFGQDHPNIVTVLNNLAAIYHAENRYIDALGASRRAVGILVRRVEQVTAKLGNNSENELRERRYVFLNFISILANAPTSANDPSAEVVDEAFRTAQFASATKAGGAIVAMAARYAAGSDALAALIRKQQDLQGRWQALDEALLKAVSKSPERRRPDVEAMLRKDLADIEEQSRRGEARLQSDFPRFAKLASLKPVSVAEVQKALAPSEALVSWAVSEDECYAFVVRKQGATFFRAPLKAAQVADTVAALRTALDLGDQGSGALPPFDVARAYGIYRQLLAPAENLLSGVKSIFVVPDGALQSLPPSLLVTKEPRAPVLGGADYKSVPWLIRRYAVTVLPSASSLKSLRGPGKERRVRLAFAGFGDPDLKGGRGGTVRAASLFRGGAVDAAGLRLLPPLPETAGELRAEAEALGAPPSSVHLGPDATVSKIKTLDLSGTRVIAFATHGLLAGDLPALAEPALVMTPPATPTEEDDGLLRASDVARLKLNADWVVLSACNTAAPDRPGAEGLSGLARAFFYAGVRSLLVSHWPVELHAAVKLTTVSFRLLSGDPEIGRAEAFRRAMLSMLDNAGKAGNPDDEAHPAYWAPFVLVGEGGEGK